MITGVPSITLLKNLKFAAILRPNLNFAAATGKRHCEYYVRSANDLHDYYDMPDLHEI